MKIRKEFVIFGTIIVAFVIFLFVLLTDNSGIHYNGDNVLLDFSKGDADAVENPGLEDDVGDVPQLGDFSGLTVEDIEEMERQARLEAYGDDDELQDPGAGYRPTNTQPVVSQGPVEGDEFAEGDEPTESVEPTEAPIMDADINESDRPVFSMTAIQYANLMVYYVCGLEDSEFERWLTPELFLAFGTQQEEPFTALRGNTEFSNITATDTSFSFTAKDGNTYAFNIAFDGDRVSSVTPA